MVHKSYYILVLLLLFTILAPTPLSAETSLTFSTMEESVSVQIAENVLKHAYNKLGITVHFSRLPGNRALHLANEGICDGEVFRIRGIDSTYTNLLRVPVPINTIESVVFTKHANFTVNGWDSLKPYRIGLLKGIKYSDQGTRGMDRCMLSSVQELFKALDNDRVDIVVFSRTRVVYLDEGQKQRIKILDPPLTKFHGFHYLHSKHQQLVPRITNVLKNMETTGQIASIKQETIKSLVP